MRVLFHAYLIYMHACSACAIFLSRAAAGIVTSTVESNFSNPLVVITNESQWESSEGALLKKDAFGSQMETPWTQVHPLHNSFANTYENSRSITNINIH